MQTMTIMLRELEEKLIIVTFKSHKNNLGLALIHQLALRAEALSRLNGKFCLALGSIGLNFESSRSGEARKTRLVPSLFAGTLE